MEICVLGSGSSGNCIYAAGGGTRLLIDAGLSLKETTARLAQIGQEMRAIDALLFTHDHADHCQGADVFHRRHRLPFYANEGTAAGIEQTVKCPELSWQIFEAGSSFAVGGLQVEPFSVPHDAADAVGFVISDGQARLGIATDFGTVTALIRRKLADCDALVLETNHDVEMLRQSGRPWSLIQRILGRHGHLSNEAAAELLGSVLGPRLRTVFLAHLSEACNTPALAERAVRAVLRQAGREDIRLVQTSPDEVSERVEL
jgi:phosphoribosyl 1,2-cyclic phosphodiesterase